MAPELGLLRPLNTQVLLHTHRRFSLIALDQCWKTTTHLVNLVNDEPIPSHLLIFFRSRLLLVFEAGRPEAIVCWLSERLDSVIASRVCYCNPDGSVSARNTFGQVLVVFFQECTNRVLMSFKELTSGCYLAGGR
jgi:hypothetical protein